ncbi:hypothetical protein PENTCL1PPCAC_4576, partial [Pristionchus entomophagus]
STSSHLISPCWSISREKYMREFKMSMGDRYSQECLRQWMVDSKQSRSHVCHHSGYKLQTTRNPPKDIAKYEKENTRSFFNDDNNNKAIA